MEISHPWHAHPLLLSDEAKFGDHCSICEKELDGNLFYACVVDCKYYVHKSCAQLPLQIQHHLHLPHFLSLSFAGGYIFCDSCHKGFLNLLCFRCSCNNFNLHVKCALMSDVDTKEREFIQYVNHEHRLTICSKDGDNPPNCHVCSQTTSDLIYGCTDCDYFLHKSCAQAPLQIQHYFHPPHPVSLSFRDDFTCDSCHKRFRNALPFRCSACDINLDVKCALMLDINTEGKEFIRHFTHQDPLIICSKDADNPLNCFACKKTNSDLIYGCTVCDYFLHKSCAEISTLVLHPMHPQHALSLRVKFGRCKYCKRKDITWKYYCRNCKFFSDVSCMIESAKDAQNSERSCFLCGGKHHLDSNSCVDSLYFINQSYIQLPEAIEHEFHCHKPLSLLGAKDFVCDSCHKWFDKQSHYGCEECNFRMDVKCALMPSIQYEESYESPVIPHQFKHQHPLQIISEDYDINCSTCYTTKLSPIYGCIKCEYFLHQYCLKLPIHIKHPLLDGHVLILQPLGHNFCQICCRKYDGFAFGCSQCPFFVGIECMLELGPILTVENKYHPHPLYLIEKSYCDRCNADDTFCQFSEESSEFKLTKSYSLRCIKCDYNLHFLCGPLPCTIKHQKSHLHVLKLVDYIVEDGSDEHYCDICEEVRNPRLCIYYFEDCKFYAHVHCVISEIINVFKKKLEKGELRIVGDLTLEDTINLPYDKLTRDLLEDLLWHLPEKDTEFLKSYFPSVELFQFDKWKRQKNSSSEDEDEDEDKDEDDTMNLIEELSFYNDEIIFED